MPTLNPNEKVLVSSIPYLFGSPRKGDIVIFKYSGKFMIKKITKIEKDGYLVEGENKNDSLEIPKMNKQAIVGKVIMKI